MQKVDVKCKQSEEEKNKKREYPRNRYHMMIKAC